MNRRSFVATIAGFFSALCLPWRRAKGEPDNIVYIKSGNYSINLILTEAKFFKMMQEVPDGYAVNCCIECEDAVDMNLINGWHATNCIWWSKKSDMTITGGNMGYCSVLPWRTSPFQSRDMLISKPGTFKGLPEGAGYLDIKT